MRVNAPDCLLLDSRPIHRPTGPGSYSPDGTTTGAPAPVPTVAACIAALTLASAMWLDATAAFAATLAPPAAPSRLEMRHPPLAQPVDQQQPHLHRSSRLKATPVLGFADKIATLHAIDRALSSVADGGAFVWERANGKLRGLIRPTASFKSSAGEVCRHIVIRLDSAHLSREMEGIACRSPSGVWTLSG